jgi:CO/xanthine dehydrogenase FAD-binding subunit
MSLWQHYHQPVTVDEGLDFLAQHDGAARVVSGGTDLLLEMQQGHKPPVAALVDVTGIAEMGKISQENGRIQLGAAVTHTRIVKSDLLVQRATCLVESCGVIGGPQVRNVATLGGNVAHALPAADGTTALVVLDAEVEVATINGRSWQPILSLFKGPGKSAVDHSRELITRFRFQGTQPGEGTAFKRIMRPQGVALPILACAVWVKVRRIVDSGQLTVELMCGFVLGQCGRRPAGPSRPRRRCGAGRWPRRWTIVWRQRGPNFRPAPAGTGPRPNIVWR